MNRARLFLALLAVLSAIIALILTVSCSSSVDYDPKVYCDLGNGICLYAAASECTQNEGVAVNACTTGGGRDSSGADTTGGGSGLYCDFGNNTCVPITIAEAGMCVQGAGTVTGTCGTGGDKDTTGGDTVTVAEYKLMTGVYPAGGGTILPNPDQNTYSEGTEVTVTASASVGYTFTGWSGDSESSEPSITVTMNADVALTANFELFAEDTTAESHTLTTGVTPAGGGIVSRSPNLTNYAEGTVVTVTASATMGYVFTGWSGDSESAEPSITVTMNAGMALTANFEQITYCILTVNITPAGGGTVSRNPNLTSYPAGTAVIVTAKPAAGYKFSGWTGMATGMDTSVTVTLNTDVTLTANFEPVTYTLMTNVTPVGGGIISRDPDQINYVAGTIVTLTVTPAEGYIFTGWSGASTSANAPVMITMDSSQTLTANFAEGFVDLRDGKSYRSVKIGTQAWMAENLNYNADGSVCYDSLESNCNIYGRLYNWAAVMDGALSSEASPSGIRGVCPVGWHVPSDAEWETLVKYVDPAASGNDGNMAGKKLKSTTRWGDVGNGTDDYGFSALPGGYGYGGGFNDAGYGGHWWSATEGGAGNAWFRDMGYDNDYVIRDNYSKTYLYSVRCVRDSAASQ
ncbi:MAG: InlB B-repeat-containing protein [Chitinispirillia bacterium]|nr:InlB B-repeat-containing protein [Chitinispirillia bacterium]MCL2241683.1 InlB B-repeat-containing protein [Chitinispirillia bacterium]